MAVRDASPTNQRGLRMDQLQRSLTPHASTRHFLGAEPRRWPSDPVATPAMDRRLSNFELPRFSLTSLLICGGCDRPLQPSRATDGRRVYLFLCGCLRDVIDAELVERLVQDRVEAESTWLANPEPDGLGAVFKSLFAQVRVGGGVEELAYVWRI